MALCPPASHDTFKERRRIPDWPPLGTIRPCNGIVVNGPVGVWRTDRQSTQVNRLSGANSRFDHQSTRITLLLASQAQSERFRSDQVDCSWLGDECQAGTDCHSTPRPALDCPRPVGTGLAYGMRAQQAATALPAITFARWARYLAEPWMSLIIPSDDSSSPSKDAFAKSP